MKFILLTVLLGTYISAQQLPHGTLIKLMQVSDLNKKIISFNEYAVKTDNLSSLFQTIINQVTSIQNLRFLITLTQEASEQFKSHTKSKCKIIKKMHSPRLEHIVENPSKTVKHYSFWELPGLFKNPRLEVIRIFLPADTDHEPMFLAIFDTLKKDKYIQAYDSNS